MRAGKAAPEALSFIANVMTCPPMPFVPEELHGELVDLLARVLERPGRRGGCRAGADPRGGDADRATCSSRRATRRCTAPRTPTTTRSPCRGPCSWTASTTRMPRLMLEQLKASDAPMRAVQLRPLGGAMARVANDATAFAHRDRAVMANVAAFYTGPDDLEAKTTLGRGPDRRAARRRRRAYVNFVDDEGPARVRDAYPGATYDRLAAIKRPLRPGQRVPAQPERGAGGRLIHGCGTATGATRALPDLLQLPPTRASARAAGGRGVGGGSG